MPIGQIDFQQFGKNFFHLVLTPELIASKVAGMIPNPVIKQTTTQEYDLSIIGLVNLGVKVATVNVSGLIEYPKVTICQDDTFDILLPITINSLDLDLPIGALNESYKGRIEVKLKLEIKLEPNLLIKTSIINKPLQAVDVNITLNCVSGKDRFHKLISDGLKEEILKQINSILATSDSTIDLAKALNDGLKDFGAGIPTHPLPPKFEDFNSFTLKNNGKIKIGYGNGVTFRAADDYIYNRITVIFKNEGDTPYVLTKKSNFKFGNDYQYIPIPEGASKIEIAPNNTFTMDVYDMTSTVWERNNARLEFYDESKQIAWVAAEIPLFFTPARPYDFVAPQNHVYTIDFELDPTSTVGSEIEIDGVKKWAVNTNIVLRNPSKIPFYIPRETLRAYFNNEPGEEYVDEKVNSFGKYIFIEGLGTVKGQISWYWDYPTNLDPNPSIRFQFGRNTEPKFIRPLNVTLI